MIKTQTDISEHVVTEEPILVALTAGVCMVGPMGRRMFASGRPIWGTRDGPITTTARAPEKPPATFQARLDETAAAREYTARDT